MSTITSILPPPTRPDRPARSTDQDADTFTLPKPQSRRASEPQQAGSKPDAPIDEATPKPEAQNTTKNTADPQSTATEPENVQPALETDSTAAPQNPSPTQQALATAAQTLVAAQGVQTTERTNQQPQNTSTPAAAPTLSTATPSIESAAITTTKAEQQPAQQSQAATPAQAQQASLPVNQPPTTPSTNLSDTVTTATSAAPAAASTNQQPGAEGDSEQNHAGDSRFRSFAAAERATVRTDTEISQPASKASDLADQLLRKLADAAPPTKQIEAATPQRLNAEPEPGVNEARLARGLRSAVSQQGGNVTLRLTPPELGTVRIQMELRGTTVSATLHAETDAGRQVLSQDLSRLRAGLESQGLSVDRLSVQGMSQSNASTTSEDPLNQRDARDPGQQQQSQNRARQDQANNPTDDFQHVFESSEPQPRPSLRSL